MLERRENNHAQRTHVSVNKEALPENPLKAREPGGIYDYKVRIVLIRCNIHSQMMREAER